MQVGLHITHASGQVVVVSHEYQWVTPLGMLILQLHSHSLRVLRHMKSLVGKRTKRTRPLDDPPIGPRYGRVMLNATSIELTCPAHQDPSHPRPSELRVVAEATHKPFKALLVSCRRALPNLTTFNMHAESESGR